MTYSTHAYGAREYGRDGLVAKAADRAFAGAMYGSQLWGYGALQEGAITGDAIGLSGAVDGYVGGYSVIECQIGIGATAAGVVTLTGATAGDIGIGATASGVISVVGEITGDSIGIEGGATGFIFLSGEVSGSAIGIGGSAVGFSGNVASYDKVAARLVTQTARGRFITDTGRGRVITSTVKGRF